MPSQQRLTEREIRNLEGEIPVIATGATRAAYLRALAAGHPVIKVQGSYLVETKADGFVIIVGNAKPRRKVSVSHAIQVRRISSSTGT
ncbi:TPA: hypothetical protein ACP37T_003587 [Pseudomonas aeruginosa]